MKYARFENLEDQYGHWLDENCKCESEQYCECMSFNEWINDLMEDMFANVSSEEEFYGESI